MNFLDRRRKRDITQAMRDDASFAAVLARADKALYRAKHDGRNRVACLDPLEDAQARATA